MNQTDEAAIRQNEKYALIAIQTDIANSLSSASLPNNLFVSTSAIVTFDNYWREWLGSIRTEHFSNSNLFVVAKSRSDKPEVLDDENHHLTRMVSDFYFGLLLAGRIFYYEKPLLLTGGATEKETSVRQLQELTGPVEFPGLEHDTIDLGLLKKASSLSSALPSVWDGESHYQRLRRVIHTYLDTRTKFDVLDRLHQYCRCIEGFIIPAPGRTARTFKSRTELFVGPSHHELFGTIYELRSAIEHLNDHLNLSSRSRDNRVQIYKWAAIVEFVARECIIRVLQSSALRGHFESDATLKEYWALSPNEKQRLWGPIVDISEVIRKFEPRDVSNSQLGLS